MKSIMATCLLLAGAAMVSAGPLWDYVNAKDDTFSWHTTGFVLNDTDSGWTGEGAHAILTLPCGRLISRRSAPETWRARAAESGICE